MTASAEVTSELSLEIGMPVDSSDHHWGVLDDIVVDPVRLKVTHLVVQPRHRHHKARLIPLDAVVSCDDRIRLSLSTEQIVAAPKVETTDFVRYEGDRSTARHWRPPPMTECRAGPLKSTVTAKWSRAITTSLVTSTGS